jgi:hypothetical protein
MSITTIIDRPRFVYPTTPKTNVTAPTIREVGFTPPRMLVITAWEACPVCAGDGEHAVEVRGGRWNPYAQGGMWEPDEDIFPCDACNGTGIIRVQRDAFTGMRYDDDDSGLDPSGDGPIRLPHMLSITEPDEDEHAIWRARLDRLHAIIRDSARVAAAATDEGLSGDPCIHGLSWNDVHTLSVMWGEPVKYYPPGNPAGNSNGFISTRAPIMIRSDGLVIPVSLFGKWSDDG